jgi:photosystem II stability/assembly factor-like uncharacterized protein
MAATRLAVATAKGLFFYDRGPSGWTLADPSLPGWEVSAVCFDPRGQILVGTSHYAYGPTVRVSADAGKTFSATATQPAPSRANAKFNRIWQIHALRDRLLVGIDEAALFESSDDGATWAEFPALNSHPTRDNWFPGGGGLCLHTIVVDHSNPARWWVGISAVGVFGTTDAGKTWSLMNTGLNALNTGSDNPMAACCVHKIAQHPTQPDTLYMQYHGGVYRTTDGAENWTKCESGVPSNFGFPMVISSAGKLHIVPLHSDGQRFFDGGKAAVYHSTDGGNSWKASTKGLDSHGAFTGVLRDAMCVDSASGVFLGTTSGEVYASADAGESWSRLPGSLPRIMAVRALG